MKGGGGVDKETVVALSCVVSASVLSDLVHYLISSDVALSGELDRCVT